MLNDTPTFHEGWGVSLIRMAMKYLITLILICSPFAWSDILIIAHKDTPLSKLDQNAIKNIYLGNQPIINEIRVIPLDQGYDSPTRIQFYEDVIQLPHNQVISHWSRLIFTGKGQSPIALAGNNSIIDFVKNNPNVIGYIDEDYMTDDVKVLFKFNE